MKLDRIFSIVDRPVGAFALLLAGAAAGALGVRFGTALPLPAPRAGDWTLDVDASRGDGDAQSSPLVLSVRYIGDGKAPRYVAVGVVIPERAKP